MSSTFQERLRAYCELVRIPAVFTAPGDVVMGCFLVALWTEVEWFTYVALVVSSVFVYCAGMALNDVQDVEIDHKRPERSIPGRIFLCRSVAVFAMQFWPAWAAGLSTLSVVALTIALTYLYNRAVEGHLDWTHLDGLQIQQCLHRCECMGSRSCRVKPDGCCVYTALQPHLCVWLTSRSARSTWG